MIRGLNELTISQAAEGLRQKQFSVTELVSDCLKMIQEKNGELRAYLKVFSDSMEQAQKADELFANNHELPPLFGIPLAIKDNILLEGKRCGAGSKMLENYTATYDATVIRKLKNQGAIFLGHTNMDEFAMGSSTENSAFGPSKNPYDIKRVPGGSSGGSAVAVASNMCLAALGSDTGGSIRQPASFCGIVGMKPTYGRVSRHGLIAMASSLDQIGPMTKSVEDAKILYEAISGKDDFDATAMNENQELILRRGSGQGIKNQELKETVIGVPKEYFTEGLDPEVEKVIKSTVKKIEDAGAKIEEISLPHSKYALPAYYIIASSEISANLARYDGIRYGASAATSYQLPATNLYEAYTKTRAWGFGPEVKRRIMLGTYALSHGYYDAYYTKAQKVRRLILDDFTKAFEKVNFILGPTAPTSAFLFGEKAENPVQMYLADIYTAACNLAGVPALSLPAGFIEKDQKKLPVGLQLIGRRFEDRELLELAQTIEKLLKF